MDRPPFVSQDAHERKSRAPSMNNKKVWFDPADDFEYRPCPKPAPNDTLHRIDPKRDTYQDIDPQTGRPVPGRRGTWRRFK